LGKTSERTSSSSIFRSIPEAIVLTNLVLEVSRCLDLKQKCNGVFPGRLPNVCSLTSKSMIARAVEIKPDSEAVNSSSAINLRIADRNFDKSKPPSRELIDVQFDRLLVKKWLGKAASSKNHRNLAMWIIGYVLVPVKIQNSVRL
jgi:hypothetical protein